MWGYIYSTDPVSCGITPVTRRSPRSPPLLRVLLATTEYSLVVSRSDHSVRTCYYHRDGGPPGGGGGCAYWLRVCTGMGGI